MLYYASRLYDSMQSYSLFSQPARCVLGLTGTSGATGSTTASPAAPISPPSSAEGEETEAEWTESRGKGKRETKAEEFLQPVRMLGDTLCTENV